MKVYNFDLLAYPLVPESAPRTPVPSSYFDSAIGSRNYQEHLDEMAFCEELGFEGVVFNEHHYSAYGTMPSPNLIASALSQRTRRIKIGVLGNILPLRSHPVRVAEAYPQRLLSVLNTERSFNYFRPGNEKRLDFSKLSWEELDRTGYILIGSPDGVARRLNEQMLQVGASHFMGMFHIGNLSHEKALASLRLFHREVMPRLGVT